MLAFGISATMPGSTSSGDAWEAMQGRVRAGCLAKANSMNLGKVEVSVDAFGTRNYGNAILIKRGALRQANLADVCVLAKGTGEVEDGEELALQ